MATTSITQYASKYNTRTGGVFAELEYIDCAGNVQYFDLLIR